MKNGYLMMPWTLSLCLVLSFPTSLSFSLSTSSNWHTQYSADESIGRKRIVHVSCHQSFPTTESESELLLSLSLLSHYPKGCYFCNLLFSRDKYCLGWIGRKGSTYFHPYIICWFTTMDLAFWSVHRASSGECRPRGRDSEIILFFQSSPL